MNACSGCNKNKTCSNANEKDGFEVCEERESDKHCRYINDDDGNDAAWCVQNWAKCQFSFEQEKCPLFVEDSFAIKAIQ